MDSIFRKDSSITTPSETFSSKVEKKETPEVIKQTPSSQPDEQRVSQEAKKTHSLFSFIRRLSQKVSKPQELQGTRFRYLVSGKAKNVYEDKNSEQFVYYTPVKGIFEKIFGRKKTEIRDEVRVAKEVTKVLSQRGFNFHKESHIATDLKEIRGAYNLKGKYVVQARKAGEGGKRTDLEKLIREEVPFTVRLDFCEQTLKGVVNLHQAGFVHGDLKGDNILHFRERQTDGEMKSILRIADFGKSRRVGEIDSVLHTGNPRFAAPEGRTSKKAEVFSSALLLVRTLEEEVLRKEGKEMIISPDQVKSDQKGEGLRGIEKFVVINDKCLQTNAKNLSGKVRLIRGIVKAIRDVRGEKEKTTSNEVRKYIEALFSQLKENKSVHEIKGLESMEKLLFSMVDDNPLKRPATVSALIDFENALKIYYGGI